MRRRGRVGAYIGKDVEGAGTEPQQAAAYIIGGRELQLEKKEGKKKRKRGELPNTVFKLTAPTFIGVVFQFEIRPCCVRKISLFHFLYHHFHPICTYV